MERLFIYSYFRNMLKWLVGADIQTDDIEAARIWQLEIYQSGKFDKLFKTDEMLRYRELQRVKKKDLIHKVMKLEKHMLRKPSIELLPKQTIRKILTWLPLNDLINASNVCQRWRQIARREFFWKSVVFTDDKITGGTMDRLLSRGTRELIIENCLYFAPTFEEKPATEYLLESLTIDTNVCPETSQYLLSILVRCRRLKNIDLRSVIVTHEICVEISKNVGLQSLKLQALSGNQQIGVLMILKSCKRLKTLKYDNQCEPLSEEEISEMVLELPSSIQVLDMFSLQTSLRDYHVAMLVKNCPNISTLNLRGCIKISNETIMHLQQLPELQYLNLEWCFGKVNDWQRSSRARSKFLYIGVPFTDSLEKLDESAEVVRKEIMKMLPGVEITLQP